MSDEDGSILAELGITVDDVAPPGDVWTAALDAAFDDSLPSDDSTVPVMDDDPAIPDDDGQVIVVDDPSDHDAHHAGAAPDHVDVDLGGLDDAHHDGLDHEDPDHDGLQHDGPALDPGHDAHHDPAGHDDLNGHHGDIGL
ncbi:MAG: hypothetical protein QM774_04045 [Gordonia sp. (in: high G+C Gram-positive bacteria)]|uniref:hypothetical protein n=1 Tax=Gordonia sp. (in: high G+C Gram-positive bacteria) TaxID=84139 RepID=UPI0039E25DBC